ncbi:MAG TPA: hypothetical protein VF069_05810 [Streptosporangiaceae bacterium]
MILPLIVIRLLGYGLAHQHAVRAYGHFRALTQRLLSVIGLEVAA